MKKKLLCPICKEKSWYIGIKEQIKDMKTSVCYDCWLKRENKTKEHEHKWIFDKILTESEPEPNPPQPNCWIWVEYLQFVCECGKTKRVKKK